MEVNLSFEKVDFEFFIYKNKIEDFFLDGLVKLTDKLLDDKVSHKIDYSNKLVAEFRKGKQIDLPVGLIDSKLHEYITNCAKEYVSVLSKDSFVIDKISKGKFWCVSQYKNDFNPAHYHMADLSGIIYLKVPECVKNPQSQEGNISFIYRPVQPQSLIFEGMRTITPEEGVLYLFPSWMTHTIYPFFGEGERRSIAFNFDAKLGCMVERAY